MTQIVRDLFINACILIAAVSLSNTFLKRFLCPSQKIGESLLNGSLAGALGCILMIFSVDITPTQIIDFRLIPIIIMALYYSPLSAMTAAVIISFFRIANFGLNIASISAVIVAMIIGAGCIPISRLPIKMSYKWIYSVLFLFVIVAAVSAVLLDPAVFWIVMTIYFIGIVSISFGLYHLLRVLLAANIEHERIAEEAKTDYLTGISNLRDMQEAFHNSLKAAEERKEPLSVMYVDIDDFKQINDTYGHLEGDKVLKNVARTLLSVCKSTDIVSRRGGDEFTVLLIDCNLEKAKKAAERLRRSVEQHEYLSGSGIKHKITVSIGLSSYPETTADGTLLIEQADRALYQAKSAGKNSFQYAEPL